MPGSVLFVDTELSSTDPITHDLGALKEDGSLYHGTSLQDLSAFAADAEYLCGHNLVHFDLPVLRAAPATSWPSRTIDTLYLSPLLFPKRPYHRLLKDDKLQSGQLNNPVNDCRKARQLFDDEVNAFHALPLPLQAIYCALLSPFPEFSGFLEYVGADPGTETPEALIRTFFADRICAHADLAHLVARFPMELAYTLALIHTDDPFSVMPRWVLRTCPQVDHVLHLLRNTPCEEGCAYCRGTRDIHRELQQIFGYPEFRTYNGEPLQERAVQAAVDRKSLLAIFPTGGGKSVTFQLPALMAGKAVHGLTVVISPLQSLMKDQVDNLARAGISGAVTVNGLLNPIERAASLEQVRNGMASLLYISPETLRSRTVENLLLGRTIARFVIDEAHCFSAWGQDFRVDYLYIGDFIRMLQEKRPGSPPIPVSCFTATAKQKVIRDICDYFQQKLGLSLSIFASSAVRENLHYTVLFRETEEEKYATVRNLLMQHECPAILYVSRTHRAMELAARLSADGFPALPFHGRMDPADKVANQNAFLSNQIPTIVATSAFGMGVDKPDVGLVVHYDISDSLENYIQEAGRAGRDVSLQADCYVLFNETDLDRHFLLLNQTKLSISEIQQVWRALKNLTRFRPSVCCSPLELAREAGWDDTVHDVETRVRTAVAALEQAGYVKRGRNMPQVFATSIQVHTMQEASRHIDQSPLFRDEQRITAKRILASLISSRSIATAGNAEAESRVDYLADMLGMTREEVISSVNLMRQEGLLSDSKDMSAFLQATDTENRALAILNRFSALEQFLLSRLPENGAVFSLRQLNEDAQNEGIRTSSVPNLRTLLNFLSLRNLLHRTENRSAGTVQLIPAVNPARLLETCHRRVELCRFILSTLFAQAGQQLCPGTPEKPVEFSVVSLLQAWKDQPQTTLLPAKKTTLAEVETALLYLSRIGALRLEGGFLVLYNGMSLERLVKDNRIRYKRSDYRLLDEFYKQKIRQIHIVGEYANLMVKDYDAAMRFVQDYFQMDFQKFLDRYFKGERAEEISRNITPGHYRKLFGELSAVQERIIRDQNSRCIVVAAGPGSGKTYLLVHKLASLLMLEDVKHDQLLMLTFSRAAATEFRKRLRDLIGKSALYVEIRTFHSFCFDLLGRVGTLESSGNVVRQAVDLIRSGGADPGRLARTVLVLDEAQDMDAAEYDLVRALIDRNDDMRVIAVGDDDQGIFEFRGSDPRFFRSLIPDCHAVQYEMTENFRSAKAIVALTDAFARTIPDRMKTSPGQAVRPEPGTVTVIHHPRGPMEQALVHHLMETRTEGTCCVLTSTNDEALQILGLLLQQGIQARLIQSLDRFSLYHLAEIRCFLRRIRRELTASRIPDALWDKAKEHLRRQYARSTCLDLCETMLAEFESVHPDRYLTDLEDFVRESGAADFVPSQQGAVLVSTIHRAKGREFDQVYLLLNHISLRTPEEKRRLYVGMTRAKNALFIHENSALFRSFSIPGLTCSTDPTVWPEPEELALQLTHRDVVLDFFKGKKAQILTLRSGDALTVRSGSLWASLQGRETCVVRFSRSFRARMDRLAARGYLPFRAQVRFIVAWKGKEDPEESAVLLADVWLRRQASPPPPPQDKAAPESL